MIVVIVIRKSDLDVQAFGNLKEACRINDWSYSTYSKRPLPIETDTHRIVRCEIMRSKKIRSNIENLKYNVRNSAKID